MSNVAANKWFKAEPLLNSIQEAMLVWDLHPLEIFYLKYNATPLQGTHNG